MCLKSILVSVREVRFGGDIIYVVLNSIRMLPILLAVSWGTLELSHTLHMSIIAEMLTSGLVVSLVETMHTVAWTAASVIHKHSPLFSVTLAVL